MGLLCKPALAHPRRGRVFFSFSLSSLCPGELPCCFLRGHISVNIITFYYLEVSRRLICRQFWFSFLMVINIPASFLVTMTCLWIHTRHEKPHLETQEMLINSLFTALSNFYCVYTRMNSSPVSRSCDSAVH